MDIPSSFYEKITFCLQAHFSPCEKTMHLSSMDRTSKDGETVFKFNKTVENFLPQKMLYRKVAGTGEEKSYQGVTNGHTLRTFLKRIQENRRKHEDKKEKEVFDSLHLEALHVQRVYDQIAPHIQDLKQRTWPRVKEFLKSLKPGSLVADIGKKETFFEIMIIIVKSGS